LYFLIKIHVMIKELKHYLLGFWVLLMTACVQDDQQPLPNPNNPSQPMDSTKARIITDTAYGTDAKHKLDIYLPDNRTSQTPIVFLVHGGAWSAGSKSDMNIIVPKLQKEWPEAAIVNLNYRLANGQSVLANDIQADVDAAVDFISKASSKLVVSANNYVMIGASAGAQIALQYANSSFNNPRRIKAVGDVFGPVILNDWDWYNSYNIVLGANIKDILINYLGKPWDSTLYASNSPYRNVSAQSVPTIIFHGTLDPVVPIYQSQWYSGELGKYNVSKAYHEYVDFHGFNDANYNDCVKKAVTFFKKHL
jgi:acetyl esterase/lipase